MMSGLLILGSGLAAFNLVRELRKKDAQRPITVLTADDGAVYSKPQLSAALAKGLEPDALVQNTSAQWASEHNVQLWTHKKVVSIHLDGHFVVDHEGQHYPFAQLVLATGARPIPLEMPGADLLLRINHLEDYRVFRRALRNAQKVIVVGAGLIGVEFASDLVGGGKHVEVLSPDSWPLASLIPQEIGDVLANQLTEKGVSWQFGARAQQITQNDKGYEVELTSGQKIQGDLVLAAVGLAPDLTLAQGAGLMTQRGIVVDRQLQTSHSDVFALGDGVQVDGLTMPFVMPLLAQAKVLANVLWGEGARLSLPPMPVVVKSPFYPVVIGPDWTRSEGAWDVQFDPQGGRALKRSSEGKLLSFVLSGNRVSERAALIKELPPVLA